MKKQLRLIAEREQDLDGNDGYGFLFAGSEQIRSLFA